MTSSARRLREASTDAEKKLWGALRRAQIRDLKFRRQHPVGPFILDFYCPPIRLAIELDGGQHNVGSELLKDARRSRWLAGRGITVVRFWNNDVLSNLDGVLTEIARICGRLVGRRSTPSLTLPLSGGGKIAGSIDIVFGEIDR